MNNNTSYKLVSIAFGVVTVLFLCVFYTYAWTEPLVAPPGGNVSAPINIGSGTQNKTGGLGVGAFTASAIRAGSPSGAAIANGIRSQGDICTDISGGKCLSNLSSGGIGGSGNATYIPRFVAGTTLGNSAIYQGDGSRIGIGTTTPSPYILSVVGGDVNFQTTSGSVGLELRSSGGGTPYIDFSNDAIIDYDTRLILTNDSLLTINGANLQVNGYIDFTVQKVCSVVNPDLGNGDSWRNTILVPSGWTTTTCKNYAASVGAPRWQMGCIFTNSYSWGSLNSGATGTVPSPNCGW